MLRNQKRQRFEASHEFYKLDASLSSSCIHSVGFIKLNQVYENQITYNLIEANLLQVVEITCIKPVDKLQQICYHKAGASDANVS